jgi:hypothetical protein
MAGAASERPFWCANSFAAKSVFYLNWIEPHDTGGKDVRPKKQAGPTWRAWSGYAFENVCLKHTAQIKSALGIAAVETSESAWFYRAATKAEFGAQIDLIIDRKDGCINLCEMKFSLNEFVIDKRYAAELRKNIDMFRRVTGTPKTLFLTMVTAGPIRKNDYYTELISNSVAMDAPFA